MKHSNLPAFTSPRRRGDTEKGMSNFEQGISNDVFEPASARPSFRNSTFKIQYSLFNPRRASVPPWCFLIALCLAAPVAGQVTVIEDRESNITTYDMIVSPAAEPQPAFRYRLLMHESDRKLGNAVPYYYRALLELDGVQKIVHEKFGDAFHDWYDTESPLADLPKEKAREALRHFDGSIMEGLREATSRTECDWGWEVQNITGPEVIAFLLPEVQEARGLSRMLALRIRLALAEDRLQEAIEYLQMNYQLGRDVAKPPFLVCALVGIAIEGIGNERALEFIAAPDSPNLYWAFAELPNPLIDLRPAARFELGIGPRVFPLLKDAETRNLSAEQWAHDVGAAYLELLTNLAGMSANQVWITAGEGFSDAAKQILRPEFGGRMLGVGWGLMGYTNAKKELIASGMSAEAVEAMPVGRVLALQAYKAYHHTADEYEKLWYMPFAEMKRREDAIEEGLRRDGYMGDQLQSKEIIPIASLLMPAMQAARTAEARLSRDMAALQVIEALRMHAAEKGEFPAALDDITIVPVPKNPATEQPFVYHTRGAGKKRTAILELPKTDGFTRGKRFEMKLRD